MRPERPVLSPLSAGAAGVRAAAGLCLVVLATGVAAQWEARFALDDALMFARYADNLLNGHGLAWNAGEPPVFGPTSLTFVFVTAFFRFLLDGSPSLSVQAASLVCGVVMLAATVALARREGGDHADSAVLAVLLGLATWTESLSAHFVTGMDTTLSMAWLACYLLAVRGAVSGRVSWWAAGAFGGALYVVRPDLLVYAAVLPAALVLPGGGGERSRILALAGGSVAVAACCATVAWLALGTPLPLSFYTKSVHGYGQFFEAQYSHVAPAEFVDFLSGYWLLILPIAIDLYVNHGRWLTARMAMERGVLAATVLFLGYHLLLTLPIMPYKERFFQPAVPALAFLTAGAVRRLLQRYAPDGLLRVPGGLVALAALIVLAPAGVGAAKALRKERISGGLGNFDLHRMFAVTSKHDLWLGLDRFSALPDDLVIATTEIGLPAALNPDKQVIDMAGLNHRDFALSGFSSIRLLREPAPDLIYLPHPHYDRMIQMLDRDERFRRDYEVLPGSALGVTLGIALRRESGHYSAMKSIVEDEMARRGVTP